MTLLHGTREAASAYVFQFLNMYFFHHSCKQAPNPLAPHTILNLAIKHVCNLSSPACERQNPSSKATSHLARYGVCVVSSTAWFKRSIKNSRHFNHALLLRCLSRNRLKPPDWTDVVTEGAYTDKISKKTGPNR